jgi:UDP-glucuronate decarboxylase
MVDGLIALMERESADEPVNLGNPTEVSIRRLADTIISLAGSTSTVVTEALPLDDPQRRRPDIRRAQHLLDFNPTVTLARGLEHTIADFRRRSDAA